MDYSEFLRTAEDFVFAEDQPEKADIIFVPGNGFPQMAERAAQLYKEGYAPYILPSGRYSITQMCIRDSRKPGVQRRMLYGSEPGI